MALSTETSSPVTLGRDLVASWNPANPSQSVALNRALSKDKHCIEYKIKMTKIAGMYNAPSAAEIWAASKEDFAASIELLGQIVTIPYGQESVRLTNAEQQRSNGFMKNGPASEITGGGAISLDKYKLISTNVNAHQKAHDDLDALTKKTTDMLKTIEEMKKLERHFLEFSSDVDSGNMNGLKGKIVDWTLDFSCQLECLRNLVAAPGFDDTTHIGSFVNDTLLPHIENLSEEFIETAGNCCKMRLGERNARARTLGVEQVVPEALPKGVISLANARAERLAEHKSVQKD